MNGTSPIFSVLLKNRYIWWCVWGTTYIRPKSPSSPFKQNRPTRKVYFLNILKSALICNNLAISGEKELLI